jgi:hypothetical protein
MQDQTVAGMQVDLGLDPSLVLEHPQHAALGPDQLERLGTPENHGRRMPCARHAHAKRPQVQDPVDRGGEAGLSPLSLQQVVIESCHRLGRGDDAVIVATDLLRGKAAADHHGQQRRRNAVAHGIGHEESQVVLVQPPNVVDVAADPVAGSPERRHRGPRQVGHGARQELPLHLCGQLQLVLQPAQVPTKVAHQPLRSARLLAQARYLGLSCQHAAQHGGHRGRGCVQRQGRRPQAGHGPRVTQHQSWQSQSVGVIHGLGQAAGVVLRLKQHHQRVERSGGHA